MHKYILITILSACTAVSAQQVMTPELLWQLGRVGAETVSPNKDIIYRVSYFDAGQNKSESNLYSIGADGNNAKMLTSSPGTEYNVLELPNGKMGYLYKGQLWQSEWDGSRQVQLTRYEPGLDNVRFSPDGSRIIFSQEVKTAQTVQDRYADLDKANAYIIDGLNYRHWDHWEDEHSNHVMVAGYKDGNLLDVTDIMAGEPFDCPTAPFGGAEDFIWNHDGTEIIYVCKKKSGTAYAVSTNTDIYAYNLASGKTRNLTEGMMGYDMAPTLSPDGQWLAFLSMERDGYEADKNRIMVRHLKTGETKDLSGFIDESVSAIKWSNDGKSIYFTSPTKGVEKLYLFDFDSYYRGLRIYPIRPVSEGQFDVTGMIAEMDGRLVVTRTDMNHAAELFLVQLVDGHMEQLTRVNDSVYDQLTLSKVEPHWIKTTDGKDMLVWVILPPNFDPNKKYPSILYCNGGPQSALSQFYSFRWNFQLMAAKGYVVIAPNRRGMPGHGVAWNEQISTDWGGQSIRDYYSAADWAKSLNYIDDDRMAAAGASYGGYSLYMMAGTHEGRFASLIAHDGLFNLESFYGTTEEMWFANWDMGGPYWEKGKQDSSYSIFNPINYVQNWDTPILIYQGGKDYRTTEDQAFQAFNAAQLRGIKSRFVYLPEENHWVLSCQNGLLWQREFFRWLEETMPSK
jgi:dipeptidyl aminopeptidase/acylaminoacyl peptidase